MNISEKELEDFIYHDLTVNSGVTLEGKGLYIPQLDRVIWQRQLNIEPYGVADIVGFYRYKGKVYVNILELKVVGIGTDHFEQIFRYKKGISVYLNNTFKGKFPIRFSLFLIGTSIDSGHYLSNDLQILNLVEFSYDLNGLQFECHSGGWHRPEGENRSFNNKIRSNGQEVY